MAIEDSKYRKMWWKVVVKSGLVSPSGRRGRISEVSEVRSVVLRFCLDKSKCRTRWGLGTARVLQGSRNCNRYFESEKM